MLAHPLDVRLYTRLYAARLGFVSQPNPRGAFRPKRWRSIRLTDVLAAIRLLMDGIRIPNFTVASKFSGQPTPPQIYRRSPTQLRYSSELDRTGSRRTAAPFDGSGPTYRPKNAAILSSKDLGRGCGAPVRSFTRDSKFHSRSRWSSSAASARPTTSSLPILSYRLREKTMATVSRARL